MSAARDSFRRVAANLDAECELAAEADARRRGVGARGVASLHALPRRVARSVSAFGTLLRASCEPGDRLWTPGAVAPQRLAAVPGLAAPALEHGPLELLPPARETMWWSGGVALETLLRVAHRRFAFELAQELGVALPGARLLATVGELEAHIASGGARAAPGERWVLKAPYSAAGRSRLRGAGPRLEAAAQRRAGKLLDLHGELLFEPWLERLADFGACASVDEARLEVRPPHGIQVDPGGVFRGIEIEPGPDGVTTLAPSEREALERCVEAAGRKLRAAGYRGPFNLDAWRYRDAAGAVGFQPLGEINARWSFGRVAWTLLERLGLRDPFTLVLGDRAGLEAAQQAPGTRVVPLLVPHGADNEAAWVSCGV
jgi:hypothetical protein